MAAVARECAVSAKVVEDYFSILEDLRGLLRFRTDFPQAKAHLLYLGNRRWHDRGIEVLPFADCVTRLDHYL
jgi:hypothetical protein